MSSTWGSGPTQFFYDLDHEAVLSSVESLGFEPTGYVFALNSYENRVYEIELEGGRKIVGKFYRPGRWTKGQILEEHELIFDLHQAEIPVSTPLSHNKKSLFPVSGCEGMYFCLYEKHKGRMTGEVPRDGGYTLGTWLARLHNAASSKTFKLRPSLDVASYGYSALDIILESDLCPEDLKPHYESLCSELLPIIEEKLSDQINQRVHGDMHLGNILWNDTDPLFVDFDDSLTAHPMQDFWLLLPGRDQWAQDLLKDLIAGYSELREWNPSWKTLIEPLRALRLMHFQSWVIKRWEDPAFPKAFQGVLDFTQWKEHSSDLQEILMILKGLEHDPWQNPSGAKEYW